MRDGILSGPVEADRGGPIVFPAVEVQPGLVVRHRPTGINGAVIDWRPSRVTLLDRNGRRHQFINERGAFVVDGKPVTLVAPRRSAAAEEQTRTRSGSRPVENRRARVARASRILVEGRHDAELLERVWGDDLRAEGVVVEPLDGMDHLADAVRRFEPGPGRRLGVLLDHLLEGTKEARAAAAVRARDVLVCGHPFVDIWAAIRPSAAGIAAWPEVPKGIEWKTGVCAALGVADPRSFWTVLLGRVESYADLDARLVGAVEQLIDFVTEPAG